MHHARGLRAADRGLPCRAPGPARLGESKGKWGYFRPHLKQAFILHGTRWSLALDILGKEKDRTRWKSQRSLLASLRGVTWVKEPALRTEGALALGFACGARHLVVALALPENAKSPELSACGASCCTDSSAHLPPTWGLAPSRTCPRRLAPLSGMKRSAELPVGARGPGAPPGRPTTHLDSPSQHT